MNEEHYRELLQKPNVKPLDEFFRMAQSKFLESSNRENVCINLYRDGDAGFLRLKNSREKLVVRYSESDGLEHLEHGYVDRMMNYEEKEVFEASEGEKADVSISDQFNS